MEKNILTFQTDKKDRRPTAKELNSVHIQKAEEKRRRRIERNIRIHGKG